MAEKISIQGVSDIITAKSGREYFTFEDISQKKHVCFIPKLKDYCKVGSEIEADLTAGKSPDDSPRLDMIYVNGKPVISVEKKTAGRSYGKSKEELAQVRQLAEAQNRSIQAQTALNRAVDLAVANKIPLEGAVGSVAFLEGIKGTTQEFYQLLQSLTLITEAKVIHKKIEEAKGETKNSKDSKTIAQATDRQQGKERTARPTSGEALELQPGEAPKTLGGLYNWIRSKDKNIKVPRVWIETEFDTSVEGMSTGNLVALYKTIKAKMKW